MWHLKRHHHLEVLSRKSWSLRTSGIASLSLFLVTVWQQSWLCECMVGVCSMQIINFGVKSGCQSTGLFGSSVSCQISRWRWLPFLFFCDPLNLLVICSLFSTVLGWNSQVVVLSAHCSCPSSASRDPLQECPHAGRKTWTWRVKCWAFKTVNPCKGSWD